MAQMPFQVWTRFERVLKNGVTAARGDVACIDLDDGSLVVGAQDSNYFPIGRFEDAIVGDGTAVAKIRLFADVQIVPMVNASTDPVDDGDVGALCYLHSATEVSMTGTSKSIAGRVWGVKGSGAGSTVYVQPALALGPQGEQGPQGEPGGGG